MDRDETEVELKVARILAQDLVKQGVDLNELGKTIAYLRTTEDWNRCLALTQRLAATGAVRSQQTRRYYQAIHDVCLRHIGREANPAQANRILGWAFRMGRLMRLEKLESQQRQLGQQRNQR